MLTQQKPGLRKEKHHSACKKTKCSLYHYMEKHFFPPGAEGRKKFRKGNHKTKEAVKRDVPPNV